MPTLNALTLSNPAADRYAQWSATIVGKTSGSSVVASSSDGTSLSVSGSIVSGTFTTAGSPIITLTETLAGATGSPRTSTPTLVVDEPAVPTLASDQFAGTAGSYLYQHAPAQGGSWAGYDGGGQTHALIDTANDIYCDSTSGSHVLSLAPVEADVMVEVDIKHLSSVTNQLAGVIARAQGTSPASFYFAEYSKSLGYYRIGKKSGGSSSTLGSTYAPTLSYPQTDHIVLTVIGSTLSLWVNGVLRITTTDTSISTAGKVGLRLGGAAASDSTGANPGMHLDNFKARYLTSLPVSTEIPPTLIGPWEPAINFSSTAGATLSAGTEAKVEDHILITAAQCSVQPATRGLKVEDGAVVRAEGIDMGGYQISMRAREHAAFVGIAFDGAGKPESDAIASGAVGASTPAPKVLVQYCRLVNIHGTDLDYWQVSNPSTANSASVTSVQQINNSNPPRFRITLAAPFPESPAAGSYNPPRRITVGGNSYGGVNRPLEGYNWSYDIDSIDSTQTIYEGTYTDLGSERWSADNRVKPIYDAGAGSAPAGTGGTAWSYKWNASTNQHVKGEHADAVQIEDDRPVTETRIENCVTGGNYQRLGNLGRPGKPFALRNVHSYNISVDPQDPPVSQTLFIKDADGSSAPPTGTFDNVWFPMIFGRPVQTYGAYADERPASTVTTVNGVPVLTYNTGELWQGAIIDGTPAIDFAPAAKVGTNWAGGLYRSKAPNAVGSITGITLALDSLSSGMAAGARIGVIDVQHTTQGEVIELQIVSNANPTRVAGVTAKASTSLIRRGLVVGSAGLQSGATYPIRIRAQLRGAASTIYVEQDFNIVVP